MPATGVRAPERMFVAVRARAPVAGNPPKIGDTMLATPWAMSSTFGLCRSFPIRSATTADISDSMAPSMATVSAGRRSSGIERHVELRDGRAWKAGGNPAEPRPDRLDVEAHDHHERGAPDERDDGSGYRGQPPAKHHDEGERGEAEQRRERRDRVQVTGERLQAGDERRRHVVDAQAQEVLDLRARNQDRDPVREPDDDRTGQVIDRGAQAGDAENQQHHAGHHRAHEQAAHAVLRDDGGNDDDERPRRAADLVSGSAERRDDEAGDDRAVHPRLRGEPRGDRKRHRQGQGDEADRHARDQVMDEQAAGVLPQRDDRRGEPV